MANVYNEVDNKNPNVPDTPSDTPYNGFDEVKKHHAKQGATPLSGVRDKSPLPPQLEKARVSGSKAAKINAPHTQKPSSK
jgi:hypothetical protein